MLGYYDRYATVVLTPLAFLLSKLCLKSLFQLGTIEWLLLLHYALRKAAGWYKSSIPTVTDAKGYYMINGSVFGILLLFAAVYYILFPHLKASRGERARSLKPKTGRGPWILPCVTSHTRQFPKRHSFAYSYLQVAFKVNRSSDHGRLLSIEGDSTKAKPWTWFSVSNSDYLYRDHGTLRQKLDSYLKSEEIDPSSLPHAYLVTAPRFLGYSFNPVSFWYLYNDDMKLKYMILEVNNTFDERRPYLLDRGSMENDTRDDSLDGTFRQTWSKDFHVSPFNSRKGSYSLAAAEPRWTTDRSLQISNTITLQSSKKHVKLVARVFSTEPGKCVDEMSFFYQVKFITSWFWVGFVTFPRILKEAAKLFFRRKLHVWYRPEVQKYSTGRQASEREKAIMRAFAQYLNHQSKQTSVSVNLSNSWDSSPSSSFGQELDIYSSLPMVSLNVITPEFFCQYIRDPNYIGSSAMLSPNEQTFIIEGKEENIAKLFPNQKQSSYQPISAPWSATKAIKLQRLLIPRFAKAHPLDIFVWRKSTMQDYSRIGSEIIKNQYSWALQSMLLADLIAFGIPEAFDALLWLIKVYLIYLNFQVSCD